MRRGRTVQIKMSSETAWTGSMITLLFVSLTANCIKLLWQQLQRSCLRNSWMFGGQSASSCVCGTQLSFRSVGDQLAIIGKVSRCTTGPGSIRERRYLEHNALPDR